MGSPLWDVRVGHQLRNYTSVKLAFQEASEDLTCLVRVSDVLKRVGGILSYGQVSGGRGQQDGGDYRPCPE